MIRNIENILRKSISRNLYFLQKKQKTQKELFGLESNKNTVTHFSKLNFWNNFLGDFLVKKEQKEHKHNIFDIYCYTLHPCRNKVEGITGLC